MKNKIKFVTNDSLHAFIMYAVKNGLAYTVEEIDPQTFHVYVTGF